MDEQEFKTMEIDNDLYAEIERAQEEGKAVTMQIGPRNCTLIIVFGPDGHGGVRIIGYHCGGRCGIWDRILGRSCQKGNRGTPDGNVEVACTCRGGWWDRIFSP